MLKKPSLESIKIEELWLGSSQDLLKELHILTRDGKLNQDSRRKLKQVYHLVQLIEPYLESIYQKNENPTVVDVGCGKSYLGFMIYDLIMAKKEAGTMIGIEVREDLQTKSLALAAKAGFTRMKFVTEAMETWKEATTPDLVCALHACDTATDDAIFFGIKNNAKAIAVVPCCQAEVARLLEDIKTHNDIETLWSYPIHKREFGSHLTNVIRALALKSQGYKVTVTELVGWEHSMKNEILMAEKTGPANRQAAQKLQNLLQNIPIRPKLIQMLNI